MKKFVLFIGLLCIKGLVVTGQSYLPITGGTLTGDLTTPNLTVLNGYVNGMAIGSNGTSQYMPQIDLNTLTASGFYKGWGMANAPDMGWWYVMVEGHDNVGGNAAGWTKQTITSYGAGNTYAAGTMFIRNQTGGTSWTPWAILLKGGSPVTANSLTEFSGSGQTSIGSNFVLQGIDNSRTLGKGPSLTFAFPANTDGSNIWEQARILATPDNNSNGNAQGRLYLQVRDLYNPGVGDSWNWRTGLMIQANGNVGIGTTSPEQKLEVKGGIKINGNSGESIGLQAWDGVGNMLFQLKRGGTSGNDAELVGWDGITFSTNHTAGNVKMRMDVNGNVGIGTTSPTEKLSVNGNIRSKKLIVTQTGWADYVFSDGYHLRPLTQVANFIKENKHLPDVPTATEVAKEGIDVGATQALLLKKIEELTLYMIEQEKRIQKLENENIKLKTKN